MTSHICLLLLLATVIAEEATTPSSQLRPRDFNHHAFDAKQFLRELEIPETTRQGPVLFPNDAPPPPRPPLIVTSRPLLESVSRSELNNTIAQQTQLSHIIRPYLARVKEYRPYQYAIATETPQTQDYTVNNGNKYYYENHTPLPPIYKALSNHANQNLLEVQRQNVKDSYGYQVREPEYSRKQNHHNRNDVIKSHVDSEDYDQSKNYAFSYRVKDQKTGDDFSHSQRSSGSATNGEYRVRLPDGRMQIVSYTADENGYQANVRYDEEDKTSGNRIDNNYNDNDNKYNKNKNQYNNNQNQYNNNQNQYNNNQNQYNNNNYNDNNDHINDRVYVNDKHHHNDYTHNEYNDKHDTQHTAYKPDDLEKYKTPNNNDYYNQYSDLSKEYYNDDLSSEYESKSYDYAPHKSKFNTFIDNKKTNINHYASPKTNLALGSTVTPSYEELKDLLVTKKVYNTVQPYVNKIPVQLNVPSTTPSYDFTTERVVFIGGKKPNLYTSVSSLPSVSTSSPLNFKSFVSSTPRNYLVSTIASLGNQVDLTGSKPVLSDSYIDRINKYLRFN